MVLEFSYDPKGTSPPPETSRNDRRVIGNLILKGSMQGIAKDGNISTSSDA